MPEQKPFKTYIDGGVDGWRSHTNEARQFLDQVLVDETPEKREQRQDEVDARLERSAAPVVDLVSDRTSARVLFVTTDQSVREPNSAAMVHYRSLGQWFNEVHVLLLSTGPEREPERVTDNVWVYVAARGTIVTAKRHAIDYVHDNFFFNDYFRPDLIVGTDPLHAGVIATTLADYYDRPLQIHCVQNYFSPKADGAYILSWWQRQRAKLLLKSVDSIRAGTAEVADYLARLNKRADVRALPRFYNFAGLRESEPSFSVHERYPDFKLVMLTFSPLQADSGLQDTLSAVRNTLLHNKIGLIVIGDGPAKRLYEKKVKLLGIEKQVAFVSDTSDTLSYLKTADVLVMADTDSASDEAVVRSIVVGTPIVAYETELRLDLLEDGESALLCPAGDPHCLSQKLIKFLNNQGLRAKFRQQLSLVAEQRLYEDTDTYYETYRNSIELALLDPSEIAAHNSTNAGEPAPDSAPTPAIAPVPEAS